MHRIGLQTLLIAVVVALTIGAGMARAAEPIDRTLVGTWDGSGTVLTGSTRKSGKFTVRIEPSGQYILILHAVDDFAIDFGPWTTTQGKFARTDHTGMEDSGTYRRSGDVFLFTSIFGSFELRPARDKQEAAFQRLANLMRVAPTRAVSDWTARAAVWATLWQPDATLDQIEFLAPSDDGLVAPGSTVSIAFHSKAAGRFLVMSPAENGTMNSAVSARGERSPGPWPIPVPIVDLSEMLQDARAAGFKGRYTSAVLKFAGDTPEQARLQWLASPIGGGAIFRQCLDVATDQLTDCGPVTGDARAQYDAFAARAAAAWTWIQQQWAQGGAEPSMGSLEASEIARCKAANGTYREGTCSAADRGRIFP